MLVAKFVPPPPRGNSRKLQYNKAMIQREILWTSIRRIILFANSDKMLLQMQVNTKQNTVKLSIPLT